MTEHDCDLCYKHINEVDFAKMLPNGELADAINYG